MKFLTQLMSTCPGKFQLVINPHKAHDVSVKEYMSEASKELDRELVNNDIANIMLDTDTIVFMEFCVDDDTSTFIYGHDIEMLAEVAIHVLATDLSDTKSGDTLRIGVKKETLH